MFEKLANDIYIAATEKLAEMAKSAVVRGPVKAMRRAKEMLMRRTHDFYGAGKGLPNIVSSGKIAPGVANNHSPLGLPEVYMGKGKPASSTWMNANTDGIIKPNSEVSALSFKPPKAYKTQSGELAAVPEYHKKNLSAARTHNVSGAGASDASQWTIVPGEVPLAQGNYAVNSGKLAPETEQGIRKLRLRRMPSQTLADAQFDLQRKGLY